MSCGRKTSARNAWVLSLLVVSSQISELLSLVSCTPGSVHVAVRAPPAVRFGNLAGMWRWGAHHQSTHVFLGARRRHSNAWENKVHCCGQIRMSVGGEGERSHGGGPRPKKRALEFLSTGVNNAILEMCVENKGRPLARALTDFVEYTIEALASGKRGVYDTTAENEAPNTAASSCVPRTPLKTTPPPSPSCSSSLYHNSESTALSDA